MKKLLLASALAVLAIGVTQAQAATLTYYSAPEHGMMPTPMTQESQLQLFDSNLGTLTGVTFGITGDAISDYWFQVRTDALIVSLDVRLFYLLTASHTAFDGLYEEPFSLTTALTKPTVTYDLPIISEITPLTAGHQQSGQLTGTGSFEFSSDDHAALLSLQQAGGGAFDLGCMGVATFVMHSITGNLDQSQTTTASCNFWVTYSYEPGPPPSTTLVPEPGTLALLGIGLSVAGFTTGSVRRKKK